MVYNLRCVCVCVYPCACARMHACVYVCELTDWLDWLLSKLFLSVLHQCWSERHVLPRPTFPWVSGT